MVLEQRERRVARLGVDEVAQRLVEQHDDALGQRVEQAPRARRRRAARRSGRWGCRARRRAWRSVTAASIASTPKPGHGHRAAAGAPRHERVQRVGGPRRDQLVAGLDQRAARRDAQQLRGAVADDDALGGDAVAARRARRAARAARRRVAVQPAARGEGDRVDDAGRRVLGPGRRATGRAARRARAPCAGARRPPRAGAALTSSSRHALELPVVVEEPHGLSRWRGERVDEPRPPPKIEPDREQRRADDAPCTAKTRPMTPLALVDAGGAAHEDPRSGPAA